jgi:myosin heavy subunit
MRREQMTRSATLIQTAWRGYFSCLNYHCDLVAITIVQSLVRCRAARIVTEQKRRERMIQSATTIQATWRGYYVCSGYECDLLHIIMVQNFIRCRAARIVTGRKRQELKKKSATIIQAQWRSFDCTMNYLHYLADVVIVQSAVRRWQATKLVSIRRSEVHEAAATKIQQTWRGFVSYADYIFTVSDIVVAQSRVRRWLAERKRTELEHDRNQTAATVIQRNWRGSTERDAVLMRQIKIIICQVSQEEYTVAE